MALLVALAALRAADALTHIARAQGLRAQLEYEHAQQMQMWTMHQRAVQAQAASVEDRAVEESDGLSDD